MLSVGAKVGLDSWLNFESHVKMYSPAAVIGCGGSSGESGTDVSCAFLPHVPVYECLTENASTWARTKA